MKTIISLGREIQIFLLFLCFFIGNLNSAFGQEDTFCGTDLLQQFNQSTINIPANIYSGSIDPNYLETFEPVVYNIYFWQVNDPNGGFDDPLTQNTVLTAVANLNIEYNQYNIFFKYRGFGAFNSDTQPHYYFTEEIVLDPCRVLLDENDNPVIDPEGFSDLHLCEIDYLLDYAKSIDKWKEDAFNVYVVNSSPNFAAAASNLYTDSYLIRSVLNTPVFIHEIGHNFNLQHTFKNFNKPNLAVYSCEHVTRDVNLQCDPTDLSIPCFNAFDAADFIIDTAAVPDFYSEYCHANGLPLDCGQNPFYNVVDCGYVGSNSDCQGSLYNIFDSDVQNYMAYTLNSCRNNFSIGQAIFMRESIDWDPAVSFSPAETTISSLYEPYTGEYYVAGPDPDPHTLPLFQPGFDYVFQSCSCDNQDTYDCENGPCEFEENAFQNNLVIVDTFDKYESNYNSITHPNHSSIYIGQLSQIGKRRCYDNWNRAAMSGSLTQFNDGVFNNNITVTPQDSTNINNSNFIDNLQPGLYKIEKNYNDGSSQEAVILKENNE